MNQFVYITDLIVLLGVVLIWVVALFQVVGILQ
jgi:hypothetical protein